MKTENLQDDLWARVDHPGYKGHYCPRKLAGALLAELGNRRDRDYPWKHGEGEISPASEGSLDLRGMIMVDRPIEKIKIDTLTLSIPSQNFAEFLRELKFVHKRVFADGQEHYKIHGDYSCVVFTPEQRDEVLKAMDEMLPAVKERAEKADREFSRRLDEVNSGGVRVVSQNDKYSKNAPKRVKLGEPKKENN